MAANPPPPPPPSARPGPIPSHITSLIPFLRSHHIHPSPAFLSSLSTLSPSTPTQVLEHTAKARFLNSDLRISHQPGPDGLVPGSAFPFQYECSVLDPGRSTDEQIPVDTPSTTTSASTGRSARQQQRQYGQGEGQPQGQPPSRATIKGPVIVQMSYIADVSKSKWSQIMEAEDEALAQGQDRVVGLSLSDADNAGDGPGPGPGTGMDMSHRILGTKHAHQTAPSTGPFRMDLHDAAANPEPTHFVGCTITPIPGLDIATVNGGAKFVLTNVPVVHGIAILDRKNTVFLGGRVEGLDRLVRDRYRVMKLQLGMDVD